MPSDIQKIKELKQMYLNVFDNDNGKMVLEHLAKRCFVHKTTLDSDKTRMAFNEGQRSIYLHIQSMMKIDIEATEKFMKQQEEENKDNVQ